MDRLTVILHVAFSLTVLVAPTGSSSLWVWNDCQPNQFTCKSGACIDTTFVCNGTAECRDGSDETEIACEKKYVTSRPETREGCVLPPQPEFGSYTSPACENGKTTCRHVPGTPVHQYWLLTFKCNNGYYIEGAFEEKVLLLCFNGTWSEKIPVCRPLCGRMNFEQRNNLLNVTDSSAAELPPPWVAIVYYNFTDGLPSKACIGTLISPHTVLTRASCVDRYRQSPHNVRVALGKRHTGWDDDEPGAVKAEVREIVVHSRYRGGDTYYAYDVALIDLNTSVAINSYIMPACVDWGRDLVLTPGQLGTVTLPWKNSSISSFEFAYKDTELCVDELVSILRSLLTPDKLCVEHIDENGDHDYGRGGVTFDRNGVHYIKGFMSESYYFGDRVKLLLATNLSDKDVLEWLQRTTRSFYEIHTGT